MMKHATTLLLAAAALFSLNACRKDEVKSYSAPKDQNQPAVAASSQTPAASQGQGMPAGHPPIDGMPAGHPPIEGLPAGHPPIGGASSGGGMGAMGSMSGMGSMGAPAADPATDLTWTPASSWTAKPASGMRRGSYSIKDASGAEADLSVIALAGSAGGLLDNINRWRGQIGLAPLAAAQLADEVTTLKSDAGIEMSVVDMTNPGGERILGAILPRAGQNWFFKLKGPSALITQEKPAFLACLKSIKAP